MLRAQKKPEKFVENEACVFHATALRVKASTFTRQLQSPLPPTHSNATQKSRHGRGLEELMRQFLC
jgi:hypothetical protein